MAKYTDDAILIVITIACSTFLDTYNIVFDELILNAHNKLEIANELGVEANNKYGSNNTSYSNGQLGGRVGGQMSKRLVEMGQQALLKQYNSKK